jgi:DNA-binding transcriptional ArsR family regulator
MNYEKETQFETDESRDENTDGRNFDFVQVSRAYIKEMRLLVRKSPLAHEILYYLVEHMGRTTNAVVVSYATLCEITERSRPTVARAIKLLKEENWIDAVRIGNATAYGINARIFWQAGRNQKKYAIFSATVIASQTEQGKGFRDKSKEKLTYIPVVEKQQNRLIHDSSDLPPPDQKDLNLD